MLRLLALLAVAMGLAEAAFADPAYPARSINQFGHRTWRVGDAGLENAPKSIAQGSDGQIWVGTTDGLYRFDGKQFTRWAPAEADAIAPHDVQNLFGARDGNLYIGSRTGLARIRSGRYYHYPKLMQKPGPFRQDLAGTVWLGKVGHHSDASSFCSVGRTALRCHGTRDGVSCWSDFGLLVEPGPGVWVGGYGGICHWQPGQPNQFYALGNLKAPISAMVSGPHGLLLAAVASGSSTSGLWAFSARNWSRFVVPGLDSRRMDIWALMLDRQGALWIGTHDKGLFRVANGRVSRFNQLDGLSADYVSDVMEDKEGSVWVATPRGIEQFFALPITRYTSRDGLSADAVSSIAATPDGGLVVSNGLAIDRMNKSGEFAPYRTISGAGRSGVIYADRNGTVWLGADGRLITFAGGRSQPLQGDPSMRLEAIWGFSEDTQGDVWAAVQEAAHPLQGWLWRFHQRRLVQRLFSPAGADHYAIDLVASDLAGGLWVRVFQRAIYHVRDNLFERVPGLPAGAGGTVSQIVPVKPEEAWLATPRGAIWLKNGHVRILDAAVGLPCDLVYGVALDQGGNLWLSTQCDLVEVPAASLAHWQRGGAGLLRPVSFGPASGYTGDETSKLVVSRDGRLWFAGGSALYAVDPARMPSNPLAPVVEVQGVAADGRAFPVSARVTVPELTRDLQIDYAALSYLQPDLLKFRYRLVGHDRGWNDVGNRRQAFYNDLAPGDYRFQISACNKDAVCSRRIASFLLVIPPAWWQTWLFRVMCLFGALLAVAIIIRWRLRAHAELMRLRFDDRLEERTRVARDLHDTLMQTVLASKLLAEEGRSIETVSQGQAALGRLSQWLGHAADEGRAAVDALRVSLAETYQLHEALELAALEARKGQELDVRLSVVGQPGGLHPIARDEIYRIGLEAIRNVCSHADANTLTIELEYSKHLRLVVRDDGAGMGADTLQAGKAGHFGLVGMRERADAIGARLSLLTSERGTEVMLVVPGKVVFADRAWWRLGPQRIKAALALTCARMLPHSGSADAGLSPSK